MEYEERESEFDIEDEDKSEPEQTGGIVAAERSGGAEACGLVLGPAPAGGAHLPLCCCRCRCRRG